MSNARYLVSIDLGTSQSLLAYVDLQHPELGTRLLEIPQNIAPGQWQSLASLPSLRYQLQISRSESKSIESKSIAEHSSSDHSSYHALSDSSVRSTSQLPWEVQDELLTGAVFGPLAEQLAVHSEGHLISSAKSWLSQHHLDPAQPILPWAAAPGVSKLSAVDASASYLRYLLLAWNQQFVEYLLQHQQVVITLPASFDDVARLYTQQAAERAGMAQVQFLEEPQAAFYDWYARHQADFSQQLANIDVVLVCDIGGGTSDFSLIRVLPAETSEVAAVERIDSSSDKGIAPAALYSGPITLQRIAVSQHLLLGGDNMDATLAQYLLQKLKRQGQVQKLSKGRLQQWRLACRLAKEQLLSNAQLSQVNVTLLGAGTRLIGDSFTEVLTRQTLMQLIADGFFPEVSPLSDSVSTHTTTQKVPLQNVANDKVATPDNQSSSALVEISLAYADDPAITRHLRNFLSVHQVDSSMRLAVLCNGGVFCSERLQCLLVEVLQPSFQQPLLRLHNPHPQQAVALGGVSYLRAQRGAFAPIRALLPRNYFLPITVGDQRMALCVLPKGSTLGQVLRVTEQTFVLRVGVPVRFELLMDQGQKIYRLGEVCALHLQQVQQLPALTLPLTSRTPQQERVIYLQTSANALGNVQLQCVTVDEPIECWDLCFDLKVAAVGFNRSAIAHKVLPKAVQSLLDLCFGAKVVHQHGQAPIKTFKINLEKNLGAKALWTIEQLRALADGLLNVAKARRRSAEHERVWWHWVGFAMRPGFGFVQDEQRIERLVSLMSAGVQYQQDLQVWREWWLAWRRVSGGLSAEVQQQIFQLHEHQRIAGKVSTEYLECLASFEYLTVTYKIELATLIWSRLQQTPQITALWWALGRIASPYGFYAAHLPLLPMEMIEPWLQQLLTRDWQQQPLIAFTAVQMVRPDVATTIREAIEQKLKMSECPSSWLLLLSGEVSQDQQLYQRLLGDTIPLGIRLNR